jgi:hypothetical protein
MRDGDKLFKYQEVLGGITACFEYFPLIRQGALENDTSNNSSIVACIHFHGNLCTERCLATIRGYAHIDTQTDKGDS